MSTSLSTSTAYANGQDLRNQFDFRHLGDLVRDDGTRELNSGTFDASAPVSNALMAASGLVEAACLKGGRYVPTDLNTTLAGASLQLLKKLVCYLAYWDLYSRRNPVGQLPSNVAWAFDLLEQLATGARIFGIQEVQDADTPSDKFMNEGDFTTLNLAADQAQRYFGTRAKWTRVQNGGYPYYNDY